jgi:hypothetical protein
MPGAQKGVNHLPMGEEHDPSMRLSTSKFIAALVGVVIAYPCGASAQSIPSPFTRLERGQEIGLFSGFASAGTGRFGYGPSGGMMFGARYGVELSGPLSFEAVTSFVSGERDIINPGRVEGDRVVGSGDVLLTTIDARLKFSFTGRRAWNGISPFLVAGAGVAFDLAGTPADQAGLEPEDVFEFGTSFFGTMGLGTRWFLTDTIALRGDGVFSLWKIDTPPGFSDPTRGFEGVAEGEWLAATSFTISLLYRW